MDKDNTKKHHSKQKRLVISALFCTSVLLLAAFDCRMVIRRYEIDAAGISAPIRAMLITDLHSCRYGENQKTLIESVRRQSPDLILLGGDIFDDVMEDSNTELFLAGIADEFPCYYVTGNHEYWSGAERFADKMAILEEYGVTILSGTCKAIEINGERINLCGVDDPDSYMVKFDLAEDPQGYTHAQSEKIEALNRQLDEAVPLAQDGNFTILLSHRPELFDCYVGRGFDLVLCGHAHGGQWRIPMVLNGVYAPNQGLFPEYAGGQYEKDGTIMIVSRGLARETTRIPRIFNRPELVILEIT